MKILIVSAFVLSAALAGCNTSSNVGSVLATANNDLAHIANYDLPVACQIVAVAEGYYANAKSKVGAKNQAIAAQAIAAADSICANPPSNVTAAFLSLYNAWTAIQAATTVPKG